MVVVVERSEAATVEADEPRLVGGTTDRRSTPIAAVGTDEAHTATIGVPCRRQI